VSTTPPQATPHAGVGHLFSRQLSSIFACDLRSLALFRIVLGLLLLAENLNRFSDLDTFYGDLGVLPRGPFLERWANMWHWSLHLANGLPGYQGFLFSIAILLAVSMIVGYQTRVVMVLSWLLEISAQARDPMILQAGDVLLRIIMLWGCFLPLGARWSYDERLRPKAREYPNMYLSVASVAIFLQVAFVYWFTVLQKTGKEWTTEGSAVYYALNIDILATRFGVWFRQFPDLMRIGTFATMALEGLTPFLLFLPVFTWQARLLGVVILSGMHANFGLFLELGNFPWVDLVSFAPLIPGEVWDWLEVKGQTWEARGLWKAVAARSASFRAAVTSLVLRIHREMPPALVTRPLRLQGSRLGQAFAALLLFITVLWNLSTVSRFKVEVPSGFRTVAHLFRIDQQWAMFSPFPMKDDGFFVIEGSIKDHKDQAGDVLAMELRKPSYKKPELGSQVWKNQRWRKYMMNLWMASNSGHRLYYARWLCREWNKKFPSNLLEEFQIYYMREDTLPDRIATPEKVSIWHHYCFK
jgi:hypothetical protein